MEENLQVSKTLGITLKKLRLEHGLTLQDMAEKTDLSAGFLSKVERNLSNPSINNLQKICYALNITVNDLAAPVTPADDGDRGDASQHGNKKTTIFRRAERSLIYNMNDMIKLESIAADCEDIKLDAMTLDGDDAGYMSSKHWYDEIGIISTGKIGIKVEGRDEYVMEKGDAILIPANTEHTVRKLSDEKSISFWIKVVGEEHGPTP